MDFILVTDPFYFSSEQLAELQSKVRSNVSSEYWLRVKCAEPDKQLFDWDMMRLRHPLYGVGDAFSMEADDQFRKKRDAEVIISLCILFLTFYPTLTEEIGYEGFLAITVIFKKCCFTSGDVLTITI